MSNLCEMSEKQSTLVDNPPRKMLESCDESISGMDYVSAVDDFVNYVRWRLSGGFEPQRVGETCLSGDDYARYCIERLKSFLRNDTYEGINDSVEPSEGHR